MLPETHIDVLQGPEEGNLLYLGQVEESRLGLRSFKKQIKDLAEEIQEGKKTQPNAPKKTSLTPATKTTQVDDNGKRVLMQGQQAVYKRRLRLGKMEGQFGGTPGAVQADGYAFVGEQNWQALKKTRYVMDLMCQSAYVTTAAVQDQDLVLACQPPPQPVKVYDLKPELQE